MQSMQQLKSKVGAGEVKLEMEEKSWSSAT
jgi:hypothetical protein